MRGWGASVGLGAATPGMTSDGRAWLPDAKGLERGGMQSHEVGTALGASIAYDQAMDFKASPMPASLARSGWAGRARVGGRG